MAKYQFFLLCLFIQSSFTDTLFAEENVSTDTIVQSLKPKARTRGLSPAGLSHEDSAFINRLKQKTRGITIEERTQLSTILTKNSMPAIDLEINFALGSARLEPTAIETLQRLGAALNSPELKGKTFLIAGHTDARGSEEYNQSLSEERANTVRSYLGQNFKLPSDKLVAVGYGQEQLKNAANPLADENRRVKVINMGDK